MIKKKKSRMIGVLLLVTLVGSFGITSYANDAVYEYKLFQYSFLGMHVRFSPFYRKDTTSGMYAECMETNRPFHIYAVGQYSDGTHEEAADCSDGFRYILSAGDCVEGMYNMIKEWGYSHAGICGELPTDEILIASGCFVVD